MRFCCSVVVSNSLQPHRLQHTWFLCPSPTPGVYSDSHPLSQWCYPKQSHPLSPLLLSSVFPSIRVFSNESAVYIRWPKYWSFSFSVSLSNEYSGLIFFRIDWFDLPAVQETLKSLLQHHNSETSVLWCSAFFMVQLSHHTWLLVKHFFPQNGSTTMVPVFCLHSSSSAGFLP